MPYALDKVTLGSFWREGRGRSWAHGLTSGLPELQILEFCLDLSHQLSVVSVQGALNTPPHTPTHTLHHTDPHTQTSGNSWEAGQQLLDTILVTNKTQKKMLIIYTTRENVIS